MTRIAAALLCAMLPAALFPGLAQAQSVPDLELDNPRIQRVEYREEQDTLLTVLPGMGLTVMLALDERIERITIGDPTAFDIRVSPEGNTFLVVPLREEASTGLRVDSDSRSYGFELRTGTGLTAAYLVRFAYEPGGIATAEMVPPSDMPAVPSQRWSWGLRGDAIVRPQTLYDDGEKIYIAYGEDQPLPAVFAIGPTGDEEMVNGHMRGDLFVIDRVYEELVFRLDDERARAQRNSQPDDRS